MLYRWGVASAIFWFTRGRVVDFLFERHKESFETTVSETLNLEAQDTPQRSSSGSSTAGECLVGLSGF